MEFDGIESNSTRTALQSAVDELVAYGICREWVTDLVIAVYLIGIMENKE